MRLDELSRLQGGFDWSRGFANLPEGADGTTDDVLARLEFSLIGITGEVGEIANILKRARRTRAQGGSDDNHALSELPQEIADVLAYLLKLASQAGIDPVQAYLVKMCLNAHRFRHVRSGAPRVISLCGPPGSGKSTLAKRLAVEHPGLAVYLERYRSNPFLGDIQIPDRDFDADASQSWFLEEVASFLASGNDLPLILDQDPTAIPLIYGRLLVSQQRLSSDALERHLGRLLQIEIDEAHRLAGRIVILLDAPPATLARRCKRKFGSPATEDFLDELRTRFMETFRNLPGTVVVDADRPVDAVLRDVMKLATDRFGLSI